MNSNTSCVSPKTYKNLGLKVSNSFMRMKKKMIFGMKMTMLDNKSQHKMLMNGMKPVEVNRERAAVVPRSREALTLISNRRALKIIKWLQSIKRELRKLKL